MADEKPDGKGKKEAKGDKGDNGADDGSDGSGGDAGKGSGDGSTKKVELVDEVDPSSAGLPGYIGIGLLGGFILGFDPLRDAAQGNGPFEDAMVRFVACLLACVAAASIIGRLLDNAPPPDDDEEDQVDSSGDPGNEGIGGAAFVDPSNEPSADAASA